MGFKYNSVRYKNKIYAVMELPYKDIILPVVMDMEDFKKVNELNKAWRCNKNGFVYCTHQYGGVNRDIYLHDVIMALHDKNEKYPIVHINRNGLDNRLENLMYDCPNKEIKKTLKKKSRTVNLPQESGIDPNSIPTYVWYMKPDKTHGERFIVSVGGTIWKSTSSQKKSLKYKLEEAKQHLRELKKDKPELFEEYSMNGDFTKKSKMENEIYYNIIHRAGHTNFAKFEPINNSNNILKKN